MKSHLLVNPRSGSDSLSPKQLAEAASERGIEPHVLRDGDDAAEVARAVADAGVLGVAGGDGSLAPVAAVAIERDLPFVCVPFGTRNHFAGDLGLDRRDPLAALDAFVGAERRIDAARVNGRLFLNNVSLGLYADLVHRRERHRRRGEALAGVRALERITSNRHRLRVRVGGAELAARILLVANNAYELDLFTLGARSRLDAGSLHLYAASGWLPRHWQTRSAARLVLETSEPRLPAAADGEPIELESPLRFEILPRALRVLVPPERDQAGL